MKQCNMDPTTDLTPDIELFLKLTLIHASLIASYSPNPPNSVEVSINYKKV